VEENLPATGEGGAATEARTIVVGDLSNGVLATAQVAEANRLSGYHVGILTSGLPSRS
jgi:hypothetical protein